MFWKSVLAIVFYPFTALWNDVMMRDIYGIKPVQIFAMLAFGVALYRFIIVPFSSGINMNFGHGVARFVREQDKKITMETGHVGEPIDVKIQEHGMIISKGNYVDRL